MPNYNKVTVGTGTRKRDNRLNLGGFQVNSLDFGHYKLLGAYKMLPQDKFTLSLVHKMKMTPLVGHTLGKCQFTVKSVFVPYRLCSDKWEDFQLNKTYVNSDGSMSYPVMPGCYQADICNMFSFIDYVGFKVLTRKDESRTPWSHGEEFRYINPFANRFDESKVLCEVVGVCSEVDPESGLPMHVSTIRSAYLGDDDTQSLYLSWESDEYGNPLYDGLDYDICVPLYSQINADMREDQVGMTILPFMLKRMATYESDDPATKRDAKFAKPFALLKFTARGKRLFDFFNTIGYGLNFGSPYLGRSYETLPFCTVDYISNYVSPLENAWLANTDFSGDGYNAVANVFQALGGVQRHDFTIITDANTSTYTEQGIHFFYDYGVANNLQDKGYDVTFLHSLDVFAWLKTYLDYLAPSYWVREFELQILPILRSGTFSYEQLFDVLSLTLHSVYDKDYFTAAWTTPNQPTENTQYDSNIGITDSSIDNSRADSSVTSTDQGTLLHVNNGISKVGIDVLNALHKLTRVTGLAGNRYIDQLFARFGVKNANSRLQRAELIGEARSSFEVDTVISNADTDGASLGDYTAHGHSEGSAKIGRGVITEYGILLVFANITPYASYYQGRDRQCTYRNRLDFYQPELDEVDATQSLRMDELYSDNRMGPMLYLAASNNVYRPNGTFGYTRLYGETKHGRDFIGGDFRLSSRGKYTNQAYHLFRDMPNLHELINKDTPLVNSMNFNIAYDSNQYERIFQLVDGDYDHFYLFGNLDCFVKRNNKPITDFSADDECDKVQRSINNGGTELV